jgi:hypothetical protein
MGLNRKFDRSVTWQEAEQVLGCRSRVIGPTFYVLYNTDLCTIPYHTDATLFYVSHSKHKEKANRNSK